MTPERLIHVVDDEPAVRRSLSFMLKTNGFAARAYEDGSSFLRDVRTAEPGCILLDIRMPHMDGLAVQEALAERGVTMPVIVMTGHGDISIAVQAMKAGALDFLEKPFEDRALFDALERGFRQLDKREARVLDAHAAEVRLAVLTAREREVLQGLVRGHPNKTIAYDLGISPRTVEIHRANVMSKLAVHSLSEALRIAFTAGLDAE